MMMMTWRETTTRARVGRYRPSHTLGWVRVEGSGFRVQGSGLRVQGLGFGVEGLGFRVQGSGFRVQG